MELFHFSTQSHEVEVSAQRNIFHFSEKHDNAEQNDADKMVFSFNYIAGLLFCS